MLRRAPVCIHFTCWRLPSSLHLSWACTLEEYHNGATARVRYLRGSLSTEDGSIRRIWLFLGMNSTISSAHPALRGLSLCPISVEGHRHMVLPCWDCHKGPAPQDQGCSMSITHMVCRCLNPSFLQIKPLDRFPITGTSITCKAEGGAWSTCRGLQLIFLFPHKSNPCDSWVSRWIHEATCLL